MSKFARVGIILCLVAGFVALNGVSAFAAPSAWSSVDVGLHMEQGQPLILVSGDLPAGTQLPYEAELAVPAGTQLQWIGEILGGPPAEDPSLQYTKTTVGEMDVYRFTLTKSRTAQFEGVASGIASVNGQNQTTALKWTAWQDVPSVRIYQRLPRGSQIAQAAENASIQPGDETYSYYSKAVANAKAGDVLELAFTYTLPTSAPPTAGRGSTDTIAIVIIAGMLLMVVALVFAIRQRPAVITEETPPSPEPKPAPKPKESVPPETVAVAQAAPRSGKGMNPKLLLLAAFGAVIVVAFAAMGSSGSAQAGTITKFFGATSPCSSTSITLMPKQGVDLSTQGQDIVDAFNGSDGIGDVTLTIATSTLDVTYCSSSHSEDSVRQIVEGTGLVTLGAPPAASAPTTATIDASGTKQTAAIDTSAGRFDPGTVVVKAGLPTEISFTQAAGCLTEVVFSALGIEQDLTGGAATVALPPLEAGTYAFSCAMGHQTGSLLVQ